MDLKYKQNYVIITNIHFMVPSKSANIYIFQHINKNIKIVTYIFLRGMYLFIMQQLKTTKNIDEIEFEYMGSNF